LNVTRTEIEEYLLEVKDAVRGNRYQIERNKNRQDNIDLFTDYVLDEAGAKMILLDLEVDDFSEVRQNDHIGYEHEKLYIFGKDVKLVERFGSSIKTVSLYIKFNKLENRYVIVISFHEQKYPLSYYFR
jgi:hypothetical protein